MKKLRLVSFFILICLLISFLTACKESTGASIDNAANGIITQYPGEPDASGVPAPIWSATPTLPPSLPTPPPVPPLEGVSEIISGPIEDSYKITWQDNGNGSGILDIKHIHPADHYELDSFKYNLQISGEGPLNITTTYRYEIRPDNEPIDGFGTSGTLIGIMSTAEGGELSEAYNRAMFAKAEALFLECSLRSDLIDYYRGMLVKPQLLQDLIPKTDFRLGINFDSVGDKLNVESFTQVDSNANGTRLWLKTFLIRNDAVFSVDTYNEQNGKQTSERVYSEYREDCSLNYTRSYRNGEITGECYYDENNLQLSWTCYNRGVREYTEYYIYDDYCILSRKTYYENDIAVKTEYTNEDKDNTLVIRTENLDASGNVTSTEHHEYSSTYFNLKKTTCYDPEGYLLYVTHYGTIETESGGYAYTEYYNRDGRITHKRYDGYPESYIEYFDENNKLTHVDRLNSMFPETEYYDENGKLTHLFIFSPEGVHLNTEYFDDEERLTQRVSYKNGTDIIKSVTHYGKNGKVTMFDEYVYASNDRFMYIKRYPYDIAGKKGDPIICDINGNEIS